MNAVDNIRSTDIRTPGGMLERKEEPIFRRPPPPSPGFSWLKSRLIVIVAGMIIVVIISLFIKRIFFFKNAKSLTTNEGSLGYKAVFLTNGQVYFGQLYNQESEYPILRDIYYLRLTQPLQQQRVENSATEKPELTLIKLGNELHGPIDEMMLNRDHILFIETLRPDSKVIEAISRYKKEVGE